MSILLPCYCGNFGDDGPDDLCDRPCEKPAMPLIPRFKTLKIGGKTECYWEGTLVATIKLSMFPDFHELDGYDVTLKPALKEVLVGSMPRVASCYDSEEDAVEAVRHYSIVAFVRPSVVPLAERPIIRPRDEHIRVN